MKDSYTEIKTIRRDLHKYPELSENEYETAKKIVNYISKYEPTKIIESVGGTGVLVVFDFKDEGPTVLFRAELDALPIQEVNDVGYRSVHDGVSHKCGHDGHMAILLGLAKRMQKQPFGQGKVVLLFQPAEENGAGAKAVLADKSFKINNPDYVFALHNLPGNPTHQILLRNNQFSASVKSVIIKCHGKTAHAAEPENGINPAQTIASILTNVPALANNKPEQSDFSLITPIHVDMGSIDYGISAGYGEIRFTIRTWSEDQLEIMLVKVREVTQSIAKLHGIKVEIEPTHHFVSNVNNTIAVDLIAQCAIEQRLSVFHRAYPFKWGEDFGLFTHKFKGAMFGLGAGENIPDLHNPDYDFPDELIPTGVDMFYKIASKILN